MPKMDEYSALRNEIVEQIQNEASWTWSIMRASGAILATGATKSAPNPYLFLSPLGLIIPGRLGEHETENPGLAWETRNGRLAA